MRLWTKNANGFTVDFMWMLLYLFPCTAAAAAAAKSLQSCPSLCDPIDGSPPGSPVFGILQARTLEWVAISFSNAWSEKWKWSRSVVSNSSNPMDCSLPGSSIHGIFQARVLDWVAIAFSSLYSRYTERPSHMLGELLWNSVMKSFVSLNCLKLFWDICYNIIKIHLWSTSELKTLHPLVMAGLGTFCKAATLLNNCVVLWS